MCRLRGWLLGVALLLAVGPAVTAANDPFAPVTPGHWSYAAVRELAEAGYFTGYPAGTFDGSRTLTRYDFAIATARLFQETERLATAIAAGEGGAPRSSQAVRADLDLVQRLARDYASELRGTGTDPDQIRQQARTLRGRLAGLNVPASLPSPPADPPAAPAIDATTPGWRGGLPGFQSLASELRGRVAPEAGGFLTVPFGDPALTAEVTPSDPLYLATLRQPTEPLDARLALQAQFNIPFGRYALSGYYRRFGDGYLPLDRALAFQAADALRGQEGFGGALSAPISDWLALNVESGVYHHPLLKSIGSSRHFRGGVHLALSDRLHLDLAYERLSSAGVGPEGADNIYQIGLQRQLGRNTSLDFLYQLHQARPGRDGTAQPNFGDLGFHSAFTRFTVRF